MYRCKNRAYFQTIRRANQLIFSLFQIFIYLFIYLIKQRNII